MTLKLRIVWPSQKTRTRRYQSVSVVPRVEVAQIAAALEVVDVKPLEEASKLVSEEVSELPEAAASTSESGNGEHGHHQAVGAPLFKQYDYSEPDPVLARIFADEMVNEQPSFRSLQSVVVASDEIRANVQAVAMVENSPVVAEAVKEAAEVCAEEELVEFVSLESVKVEEVEPEPIVVETVSLSSDEPMIAEQPAQIEELIPAPVLANITEMPKATGPFLATLLNKTREATSKPATDTDVRQVSEPALTAATRHGSQALTKAFAWLRKNYSPAAKKQLKVAETVSLGEKRFVAIVHVEGKKFLIGGGSQGVSLLTQLSEQQGKLGEGPAIHEWTEQSA